jgi:hypothetical protein
MNNTANVGQGILGAFIMLAAISTSFLAFWRKWGANTAETLRSLPGDELVAEPRGGYTHAITISAPRGQVWPWVAQTGQDRGGFYSYDFLENLVGCDIHTVDRIVPGCQYDETSPGLKMHPKMPPMPLTGIERERSLVFGGKMDADTPVSWVFYLEDTAGDSTRLISRWRFSHRPSIGMSIAYRLFLQPIACVMQRKMLLGIKQRAENTAARPAETRRDQSLTRSGQ